LREIILYHRGTETQRKFINNISSQNENKLLGPCVILMWNL